MGRGVTATATAMLGSGPGWGPGVKVGGDLALT
jgi:hypothetical protein